MPKVGSLSFELLSQVFKFGLPTVKAGRTRSPLSEGHLLPPHTLCGECVTSADLHWKRLTSAPAGSETSFSAFKKKIKRARDSQNLSSTQYFCFHARVSAEA